VVVLLGFFVVLLGLFFQIFKSFFVPANAFLLAAATTVLIITGAFGIREGITYDTTFTDMKIYGGMRMRQKDNWDSATSIEFTPKDFSRSSNYYYNSYNTYYDTYKLNGNMTGTIT